MLALSTRAHGTLHYLLGLLLAASPWLLGFADVEGATWTAVGAGVALLALGLLTDYETGAVRWVQVPAHLWLDGAVGLLLAISPWLVGFDQRVWIPHLATGVLLIVLALFSHTIPGYERRRR